MTLTPELARYIARHLRTCTPESPDDGRQLHAVVDWLEGAARLDLYPPSINRKETQP